MSRPSPSAGPPFCDCPFCEDPTLFSTLSAEARARAGSPRTADLQAAMEEVMAERGLSSEGMVMVGSDMDPAALQAMLGELPDDFPMVMDVVPDLEPAPGEVVVPSRREVLDARRARRRIRRSRNP